MGIVCRAFVADECWIALLAYRKHLFNLVHQRAGLLRAAEPGEILKDQSFSTALRVHPLAAQLQIESARLVLAIQKH
jgi:hypothetical protein